MEVVLYIAAGMIAALSCWLIFRSEVAETAAYARYLANKQRKQETRERRRRHRFTSEESYLIIPIGIFVAFWVIWSLFH